MEKDLVGKRMVIVGFARQGMALAGYVAEHGGEVIVTDLRPASVLQDSMNALQDFDIEYVLGDHPLTLLDGADMLAVSGGVPEDLPLVRAARDRHIEITNDSHEFAKRCPATIVGITGSAGKTTTTALLGEIARAAGRQVWVGGNIGRPLISDVDKMAPGDLVIQELSSFQLQFWQQSPPVAAVLNITPNHLDRHKTMSAYRDAKANIVRHQHAEDVAVLGADDAGAMSVAPLVRGRLRLFSIEQEVADGAFVRDAAVWLSSPISEDSFVITESDIPLRGKHNVMNICAAVALADSIDIPIQIIAAAIVDFRGVEHRLELVEVIDGVAYFNDSIATAPERAMAALSSFDEPLILLAGGKDKKMIWEPWARAVRARVKRVILFGELADQLQQCLEADGVVDQDQLCISHAYDLPSAVELAAAAAQPGDVVLLSPGGTSYDAYQDFAARGEHFKALVRELA